MKIIFSLLRIDPLNKGAQYIVNQKFVQVLSISDYRYVAPLTVTAYLYVKASRELQTQEGPLAVAMFEARSRDSYSRHGSRASNDITWAIDLSHCQTIEKATGDPDLLDSLPIPILCHCFHISHCFNLMECDSWRYRHFVLEWLFRTL